MSRSEFFHLIADRPQVELDRIKDAYWLAKEAHRKQVRDDGKRYFDHPCSVARRLIEAGHGSTSTIIEALIHDVPEDCFVPPRVILRLFGKRIATEALILSKTEPVIDGLTGMITERKKKDLQTYYDGILRGPRRVRLVKCYDRLDNLEDVESWNPARRRKYALETRQFVLPIAEVTCVRIAQVLRLATDAIDPGADVTPEPPRS